MQTTIETRPARRLPPGPRGLPLIGSALAFGRDPLGFLTRCARTYGDVAAIRIGGTTLYLVSSPALIEEVLVTSNRTFPKEDIEQVKGSLDYLLFGTGLLTSNGEFWLRQRRLAQPAFHRQRIAGYGDVTVQQTEHMLLDWRDRQTFDVHEAMMALTLKIVAQTLFGSEIEAETAQVGAALDVVMQVIADSQGQPIQLPYSVPTPRNRRFVGAVRQLEAVISRMIRERRASGADTGDLLSMLLGAQDEDGSRMTDKQLRDEVITLFLAGHETTALALSWTLYLLAQSPQAEERLGQELDQVLGGRAPTLADLPQLRYTDLVLKEAMRLYPPAWIMSSRVAADDYTLGGFHVPRGTTVALSQWVTHRDPQLFDAPEQFLPERWEDGLEKRLPRFAYFPFGGGPRLCIGQSFALMEATLILATVAQRYRLALAPGQRIEPQPSITLRPRHGVRMTLRRRG